MARWLYFPPVLSFPLVVLAAVFHNRDAAQSLPPVLLGGLIASYLCLCAVSGYYIARGGKGSLTAVTTVAQGVLLTALSLQMGSSFFSWLGLVFLLVGLILCFFHATGGPRAMSFAESDDSNAQRQNAIERERTESLLGKLSLPVCITDSKGIVLGATNSFFTATGKERGDVEGEMISDILPPDREEMTFESGTWWIEQANEGSRSYFALLPTQGCKPVALPAAALSKGPNVMTVYDAQTGLYTDEYRKIRGPEEVARAQRYRRWLSGLLLELTFDIPDRAGVSEQHKEMMYTAFGQKVKDTLRSMDCGFVMPKGRVQVLLPETPQAGAKTLLGRLILIPEEVFDEDIRSVVHPVIKGGLYFFNGNPPMDYGIFSASLEDAFTKMREGIE